MAKVTLTNALAKKDLGMVKEVVDAARTIYKAKKFKETDIPKVETIHGYLPVTAVFDRKSKLAIVQSEYASLLNAVADIPVGDDKEIEVAKLIAKNKVLYFITQEASSDSLI